MEHSNESRTLLDRYLEVALRVEANFADRSADLKPKHMDVLQELKDVADELRAKSGADPK